MRNAFTLIELLGVIVLLGVLSLVAIPAINNSLNKSRENLNSTQEKQIIKGAKDFFADHLTCLPGNDASKCNINCVTQNENNSTILLSCLQQEGYLPLNITNPKTNNIYSEMTQVIVKASSKNNFTYEIKESEE